MTGNWVWRHDGTLQCGLGNEESLDEARSQLGAIIGDNHILAAEKRDLSSALITLCGAPTGRVNAFELTAEGYYLLFHGFPGSIGFAPWIDAQTMDRTAGQFAALSTDGGDDGATATIVGPSHGGDSNPTSIHQLYGRVCRVYRVGDALTKDLVPGRFNIGLSNTGRAQELWFG